MSFYTSLTGLQGAQTDLSTISNNVANVGTNGFKRSRVEFGDIISTNVALSPSTRVGSGTLVKAIRQQFSQGALQQTTSALDLSISGEGFFAVKPSLTGSQVAFTRNGSFTVDENRYVTDSSGDYLQVYPVDGTGNVVASGLESTKNLQLPLTSGTPIATSTVNLSVNLPSNSEIIPNQAQYTSASPYKFDRFDEKTYNTSNTTTIYDSTGNPLSATNYYVKVTPTGTASSQWQVYTFVGDKQISPTSSATQPAPLTLKFGPGGQLGSPTAAVGYTAFTPDGGASQAISFNYGTTTTQLASPFAVNNVKQDGVPVGQLDNVTVDSKGTVMASFSNGTTQALGKVVLANFDNPSGLKQLGNALWSVGGTSGEPMLGESGTGGFGAINSGSLEKANVDITEELVLLISAQRNFQANAKAIETDNTLATTIINMRA